MLASSRNCYPLAVTVALGISCLLAVMEDLSICFFSSWVALLEVV